jgi:hypothetical protein
MQKALLVLLLMFLVAFPKGGVKLGPVPITFGYILLGVVTLVCALANLGRAKYRAVGRRRMLSFWATVPLQGVSLLLAARLASYQADYTFAFIVGFVFLPWALLLLLAPQIHDLDFNHLQVWLRRCTTFIAVYGMFLFVYVIVMKKFFFVPYLTVNAGDASQFASGLPDKDINRGGGIFKLISTYNNGNIYGVGVLMLLPLYDLAQRSRSWRLVVRASLLMTLSRTVWVGLVAYELIAALYLRKLRRVTLIYVLAFLAAAAGGVLYLLVFMHRGLGFLFDPTLGGRTEELQGQHWLFVPASINFPTEIVYANVFLAFGLLGLICFLVAMLSPVALAMTGPRRNDPRVRAAVVGMAMLLICGTSDGPILLIPIMVFYWMLASLAVDDEPAIEGSRLTLADAVAPTQPAGT